MSQDGKTKTAAHDNNSSSRSIGGKRKKTENTSPSDALPTPDPQPGPSLLSARKREGSDLSAGSYKEKNKNYIHEGMNQFTQQFLRKMARSKKVPVGLKQASLLPKLVEISKTLHFNELEIVVWSLALDFYGWSLPVFDRDTFLLLLAFQTKHYFNNKAEMTIYYSRVSSLHSDFPQKYKEWIESPHNTYRFSPIELNTRYNKYRKIGCAKSIHESASIDYNESVEELLRISAHTGPEPGAQELNDTHCIIPLPKLELPAETLPKGTEYVPAAEAEAEEKKQDSATAMSVAACTRPKCDAGLGSAPLEDVDSSSRFLMNLGASDGPSMGAEAFQQIISNNTPAVSLTGLDEPAVVNGRSWSSTNLLMCMSRQSTILDPNKLLANPMGEEEKKEEEPANQASSASSIADFVKKTYFSQSTFAPTEPAKDDSNKGTPKLGDQKK